MRRNRRGSSSDDESTTININVTNIDASTTHIRPGPTRSGGGGKGGGSGGNKGGGRSVTAPIKKDKPKPNISMGAATKTVVKAFQENVICCSMDQDSIMVGLENGSAAVVLRRNKHERFVTEPLNAGAMITAVCCDTFDVRGQSLYYAGDALGYLHVMGENGNLIDSLQVRDDAIISIQDVEARKVWVFSENGRTVVNLNNNKLVVQAQRPSKWSMAEDGQVFQKRERGAFGLEEYECTHPARLYGTSRINIETAADNSYAKISAFGCISGLYKDLVEENKVDTRLEVSGRNNMKLKTLEFDFPVKQVISRFTKNSSQREDAVYILTTDDKITRVKATDLADRAISGESIDKDLVFHDPADQPLVGDLGDIETFAVWNGVIMFAMRDSNELFTVDTTGITQNSY
jgi:hypothetical protein